MRHILYKHFGLTADPWGQHQDTADTRRIMTVVAGALAGGDMVSVVGERGGGKTHAIWRAIRGADCQIIEPLRLDKNNLHIGDIQTAIVVQLSDERPRHSAEARAGQVRRLLKTAAHPVLLIDDAHLLHHQTLRAIKRLRELGARGARRSLLPVILIGQSDPTANIAEVALRTDTLTLAGLTSTEAEQAITDALGDKITPEAARQIAGHSAARNWLDLQAIVHDCLADAMTRGATAIDEATVNLSGADTRSPPTTKLPQPGRVADALGKKEVRRVA